MAYFLFIGEEATTLYKWKIETKPKLNKAQVIQKVESAIGFPAWSSHQ